MEKGDGGGEGKVLWNGLRKRQSKEVTSTGKHLRLHQPPGQATLTRELRKRESITRLGWINVKLLICFRSIFIFYQILIKRLKISTLAPHLPKKKNFSVKLSSRFCWGILKFIPDVRALIKFLSLLNLLHNFIYIYK